MMPAHPRIMKLEEKTHSSTHLVILDFGHAQYATKKTGIPYAGFAICPFSGFLNSHGFFNGGNQDSFCLVMFKGL